ncbi:4-hydroxy-L-threonine phosphate dehydrogenase PdxA [Nitrobacteraceae bacterium AZCC 2146]
MTSEVVALTIGDPNGIGPEIAVKAAALCAEADGSAFPILVGDEHVIRFYGDKFAPGRQLLQHDSQAGDKRVLRYHHVDALAERDFQPGKGCAEGGRATVAYVKAALDLVAEGHARSIVACPHSETNVNAAGIKFSGYPSLLARLKKVPEDEVFLMLVGAGLRIVHVTLHERLFGALERITPALIERAIRTTIDALRNLGIHRAKIGVFGINPHAGEGGLFGDDDDRIVKPLVERLKAEGINIEGPVGADLMLGQQGFDAFVAMYHDQGHIPVKLLAGRNSAAMSIGARLMFSSVGHGSAFDIAGKGIADPGPVLRCIQLLAGANEFKESAVP